MADKTYRILAGDGKYVNKTLKDMGNGTYAEVVATEPAGASGASAPVDRSGTIAVGGTAQSLMPANSARKGFSIQNQSGADLWFNEMGVPAVIGKPSFVVQAGELYETPSGGFQVLAVSIVGASTGQAFTAREW